MVEVEGMSPAKQSSEPDAGLNFTKPSLGIHPAGPSQHGVVGQAERAFSAASTFLSGILAISASQLIGAPLKLVDPAFYEQYMAWTKESFAVLVSTMTQLWAPTVVRVTGDNSMKEQLYQMKDGSLRCNFPHRLVMMANHQLYTDWLYLWWIAYTNKMHGRIYIILKESLKNVPIFGWGAQFYNFIFLSRKWATDKPQLRRHLNQLGKPADPMWLLIFPEGTNLSAPTREASKAWAQKTGVPDMKHLLLPRSTGLQFCLQELKQSTNWLYDCTIAYEGIPEGQFGQDIFTLRSSLFEGRPPKSVNMHWRRWRISDLPLDDPTAFSSWLHARWTEKDFLLNHFCRHRTFPEGDVAKAMKTDAAVRKFAATQRDPVKPLPRSSKFITTEVRAGGIEEFMNIFSPVAAAASAISNGQLVPEGLDLDALMGKIVAQNQDGKTSPPNKAKAGRAVLPSSATKATEGRKLDPAVRRAIEYAHAASQRRLERASAGVLPKKAPDAKAVAPLAPTAAMATRPLTTLAVQRGGEALAGLGPKIGAGRKAAQKHMAPKSTEAKKPHPLAGRTIDRATFEARHATKTAVAESCT